MKENDAFESFNEINGDATNRKSINKQNNNKHVAGWKWSSQFAASPSSARAVIHIAKCAVDWVRQQQQKKISGNISYFISQYKMKNSQPNILHAPSAMYSNERGVSFFPFRHHCLRRGRWFEMVAPFAGMPDWRGPSQRRRWIGDKIRMNEQRRKTDVRRWLYMNSRRTSASDTFAVCLMCGKIYWQMSLPLFIWTLSLSLLDTVFLCTHTFVARSVATGIATAGTVAAATKIHAQRKFIFGRCVSILLLHFYLLHPICEIFFAIIITFYWLFGVMMGFRDSSANEVPQQTRWQFIEWITSGSDGIFLLQEIISNQLRHSVVQNLPFAYPLATCTAKCTMYRHTRSNPSHKWSDNK